jgi:hypothetical protein
LKYINLQFIQRCIKWQRKKTKDHRVNSRKTEAFKIGEEAIERVDDFLYLGSKIDENGGTLLDIQQRMNKARGAFSRLKNVWRAKNISCRDGVKGVTVSRVFERVPAIINK